MQDQAQNVKAGIRIWELKAPRFVNEYAQRLSHILAHRVEVSASRFHHRKHGNRRSAGTESDWERSRSADSIDFLPPPCDRFEHIFDTHYSSSAHLPLMAIVENIQTDRVGNWEAFTTPYRLPPVPSRPSISTAKTHGKPQHDSQIPHAADLKFSPPTVSQLLKTQSEVVAKTAQIGRIAEWYGNRFENPTGLLSQTASVPAYAVSVPSVVKHANLIFH